MMQHTPAMTVLPQCIFLNVSPDVCIEIKRSRYFGCIAELAAKTETMSPTHDYEKLAPYSAITLYDNPAVQRC